MQYQKIHDRSPLNFPHVIMAENGHEFMGAFNSLMKKQNFKIVRSLQKKKVTFVKHFNETIRKGVCPSI